MTRTEKLTKLDALLRAFEGACIRANDATTPYADRYADRVDRADLRSQILVTAAEPVQ